MNYLKRFGLAGLGVALLIAACGKEEETPVSSTPTAGSGGSAGSSGAHHMGAAGAGGDAQGGDANDCLHCDVRGTCGPYPLSDLCKPSSSSDICPKTPEDLLLEQSCGPDFELVRYESECGGTVVTSRNGLGRGTWTFDADDKLVGILFAGDAPHACEGGGEASSETYGEPCAPKGQGQVICDDESATCVRHDACDLFRANFGCPKDVHDYDWLCGPGGAEVTRTASSCSGTRLHASNGIQTVDYDFDAEGKLIGVHSVGDVGDCDSWGLQCKSVGEAEELCNADGAGGAAGAGGAGGNP